MTYIDMKDHHKHKLRQLPFSERHEFLVKAGDPIEEEFAYFVCTLCGHHFYIRKKTLHEYLTGRNDRPLKEMGGVIARTGEGEWLLLYTLIS